MNRKLSLTAIFVAASLAAACGKKEEPAPTPAAPAPAPAAQAPAPAPAAGGEMVVRIGHVGPVSGPQAHYGKDNENGSRMAIEDLNTQNIVIGGKKVKFEIQAEDDAADPKQGTAAAQKLCDAKVNGVVGHLNSGTTIPASKVYNDCGIPHVTGAATNPDLTKPGYNTTYRIIANDLALGAGLANYAADDLKLKKISCSDAVLEQSKAQGQRADDFDGNVVMATSEIGQMLDELIAELDGVAQ